MEVAAGPGAGVVEFPGAAPAPTPGGSSRPLAAWPRRPGRMLHAASGDGWLVRRIVAAGGDAYGVDPRTALVDQGVLGVADLRGEDLADHLRAVAPAGTGRRWC